MNSNQVKAWTATSLRENGYEARIDGYADGTPVHLMVRLADGSEVEWTQFTVKMGRKLGDWIFDPNGTMPASPAMVANQIAKELDLVKLPKSTEPIGVPYVPVVV